MRSPRPSIPVRLAKYGDEQLISRSQAKRLLARIDKFKVVLFEFDKVDTIGQAFADEVFRVFTNGTLTWSFLLSVPTRPSTHDSACRRGPCRRDPGRRGA